MAHKGRYLPRVPELYVGADASRGWDRPYRWQYPALFAWVGSGGTFANSVGLAIDAAEAGPAPAHMIYWASNIVFLYGTVPGAGKVECWYDWVGNGTDHDWRVVFTETIPPTFETLTYTGTTPSPEDIFTQNAGIFLVLPCTGGSGGLTPAGGMSLACANWHQQPSWP